MSERHKVIDSSKPNFITLTVVEWTDLFIRPQYRKVLDEALNYYIRNKGLNVHAYVYMTSHIHLVVSSDGDPLPDIIRNFKLYTTRELSKLIESNTESRRNQLRRIFQSNAAQKERGSGFKIWQDGFHPVLLDTPYKVKQRIDYVHKNPVKSEFVLKPEDYQHSSARSYAGDDMASDVMISVYEKSLIG